MYIYGIYIYIFRGNFTTSTPFKLCALTFPPNYVPSLSIKTMCPNFPSNPWNLQLVFLETSANIISDRHWQSSASRRHIWMTFPLVDPLSKSSATSWFWFWFSGSLAPRPPAKCYCALLRCSLRRKKNKILGRCHFDSFWAFLLGKAGFTMPWLRK